MDRDIVGVGGGGVSVGLPGCLHRMSLHDIPASDDGPLGGGGGSVDRAATMGCRGSDVFTAMTEDDREDTASSQHSHGAADAASAALPPISFTIPLGASVTITRRRQSARCGDLSVGSLDRSIGTSNPDDDDEDDAFSRASSCSGRVSIHFDEARRNSARRQRFPRRKSRDSIGSLGALSLEDFDQEDDDAGRNMRTDGGDGGGEVSDAGEGTVQIRGISNRHRTKSRDSLASIGSQGSLTFDDVRAIARRRSICQAPNDSGGGRQDSMRSLTFSQARRTIVSARSMSDRASSDNDSEGRAVVAAAVAARRCFSMNLSHWDDDSASDDGNGNGGAANEPPAPGFALAYQDDVLGAHVRRSGFAADNRGRYPRSASMDHGWSRGNGSAGRPSVAEQLRKEREETEGAGGPAWPPRDGSDDVEEAGVRRVGSVLHMDALASWLTRPRKRESIDHMRRMAEQGSTPRIVLPQGLFVAPMECENLNGRWRNAVRDESEAA